MNDDAYDPFHDRRRRLGEDDAVDPDDDGPDDDRGPRLVDGRPLVAAAVVASAFVIWVLWAFY